MVILDNILIVTAHYSRATLPTFPFLLGDPSGSSANAFLRKEKVSLTPRKNRTWHVLRCVWGGG